MILAWIGIASRPISVGLGDEAGTSEFRRVDDLSSVVAIMAGPDASSAITSDGSLFVTGTNTDGALVGWRRNGMKERVVWAVEGGWGGGREREEKRGEEESHVRIEGPRV